MIYLLFIFLAGVCDAVRDTVLHKFERSRLSGLNPNFWDAKISWLNKYERFNNVEIVRTKFLWVIPIPVVFTDAWHLFKGLHTVFIVLAIVFYTPHFYEPLHSFIFTYLIYKTGFNLFYKAILNR